MKDTYPTPDYKKSKDGKYYIVYNKNSGKILKNRDYKKVDFTKFLEESKFNQIFNENINPNEQCPEHK